MRRAYRFELERAIAAWRRPFEHNRAFSDEDIEELESNLRDRIEALIEQGLTEEAAFRAAVGRMGSYAVAEAEYRKVYWGKLKRQRQLLPEFVWRFTMLKNYLIIALRNLKRKPGYTVINVAGLAVGMACCLLIGLYLEDELSFDRFHEQADRLLILGSQTGLMGSSTATPYPLGTLLATSIPEVEQVVRTVHQEAAPVIREAAGLNTRQRVLLTEPAFFDIFSFPLLTGDPRTALRTPEGAVITERLARAYFGNQDPIGERLQFQYNDTTYTVTVQGVALDPPANSTLQFDLVAPLSLTEAGEDGWTTYMYGTYVLLREGTSIDAFNQKLAEAVSTILQAEPSTQARQIVRGGGMPAPPGPAGAPPPAARSAEGRAPEAGPDQQAPRPPAASFFGLPLPDYYLSDLHPSEGFKGQRSYLYLFGSIALFVLLIAAINYVNLVTARATERAREVGVRKSLGAGRTQLARQFLCESTLLSTAALLAALVLTAVLLPAFNALFDKSLALGLQRHTMLLLLLPVFVLGVGILAGTYPAFVLARFQPAQVLRGAGASGTSSGGRLLREALVVLQFTISVVLLIGTAIIYRQLDYTQAKNLGFNGEQVVVLDLPAAWTEPVREAFKQRAQAHAGVVQAALASAVPGRFNRRQAMPPTALSSQARTDAEILVLAPAFVDYDFIATLDLKVLAGRGFSRNYPSDETRAYILNQTAVEALGWTPAEAIGRPFRSGPSGATEGEVIGVVEDFHIASLHDPIEPVVLQLKPPSFRSGAYVLAAKLAPEQIRAGIEHLEQTFARMAPGEPFHYTFLDDAFAAMYRSEQQLSRIFTLFAALAIVIACLGLFGLAAYTAERRTKEIGIRKVMGATVPNIVALLSRDFLKLVLIAFVVAAPLAYFGMERWLNDFAYRIEISWWIFLVTGLAALGIALLTVSYQAIRAALANPVESLRYE